MPTLISIVALTVLLIGGLTYWSLKDSDHPWFKHPPMPKISSRSAARVHRLDRPRRLCGWTALVALVVGFVVPQDISTRFFGLTVLALGLWFIIRQSQQFVAGRVTDTIYDVTYFGTPAKIGMVMGLIIGAVMVAMGLSTIFS